MPLKLTFRWCAAQELKKQSWRFHKQYLTWFQRAHNPQAITEDYEQGGYFYFDWENSWCQRKKSDFRFEVNRNRSSGGKQLTCSIDGSQNIDNATKDQCDYISGATSSVQHMHPTTDRDAHLGETWQSAPWSASRLTKDAVGDVGNVGDPGLLTLICRPLETRAKLSEYQRTSVRVCAPIPVDNAWSPSDLAFGIG